VLGVRRWKELATDRKKMAGYCSTGQSPQRAVVLMQEKMKKKKAAEVSPLPPTLSSADVKERVELYPYYPSGNS
jgi:hypothetical protein